MAKTHVAETRQVPAKTSPSIPGPPRGRQVVEVRKLARALEKAVEGEVRFDAGTKAMYASDASNFRQVPIGVVIPKTLDDVVAVHRICEEYGAPVLNRGGGTSLSGETVNYAVVIDHSKYLTRIGEFDEKNRRVTCEPGVINEELNRHTGKKNLVFGPDPSTHSRCVIGGNIGNNSCGIHSVQSQLYGPGPRTSDNVHALEVVTYGGDRFWVGVDEEKDLDDIIAAGGRKGEIYAALRDLRNRYADAIRAGFPSVAEMPRRVSGYNLDELLPENGFNVARALCGTESTCATALQAVLLLTPALLMRTLVVVEYKDMPTPPSTPARSSRSSGRSGWRPSTSSSSRTSSSRTRTCPTSRSCPCRTAARGCSSRSAPTPRRSRSPGRGAWSTGWSMRRATTPSGSPPPRASRRAAPARTCGRSARPASAPPRSRRARTTGPAGRTRPSRRPRRDPTSARCAA